MATLRISAVIQQRRNDARIFSRLGKAAMPSSIKDRLLLSIRLRHQLAAHQVAGQVRVNLAVGRVTHVHPREALQHGRRREHIDVLDAQRLEDVLLEVFVERLARGALHQLARPVDVDTILPPRARLVDQGLREELDGCVGELV